MSLPADIARCPGANYGTAEAPDWRESCDDCQRRTDRSHQMQTWGVVPPAIIVFECEYRIPPAPTT